METDRLATRATFGIAKAFEARFHANAIKQPIVEESATPAASDAGVNEQFAGEALPVITSGNIFEPELPMQDCSA